MLITQNESKICAVFFCSVERSWNAAWIVKDNKEINVTMPKIYRSRTRTELRQLIIIFLMILLSEAKRQMGKLSEKNVEQMHHQ